MSRYVPLCPQTQITGTLKLFISDKIRHQMTQQGVAVTDALRHLSGLSSLLFYPQGEGRNRYYALVTEYGIFFCNYSDEHQNLSVTKFQRDHSLLRNKALREGITFKFSSTLYISLQTASGFENFRNGSYTTMPFTTINSEAVMTAIERAFLERGVNTNNESGATDEPLDTETTLPISDELETFLSTAERYADLDHETAVRKAALQGDIHYSAVEGGKGDAKEETCLRFLFYDYEAIEDLKPDMVVNVTDVNGNILGAEITAVSEPEEENVFAELTFSTAVDMEKIPSTGDITLSVSPNVRDTQLVAIEKIRNQPEMLARFERILANQQPSGMEELDKAEIEQLMTDFRNREYPLTDSQCQAVLDGIRAKDTYLVMGPPGTGKTTVILEWVKYFVLKKHQRVLIASQNNTAVDNVLKRLVNVPGFNVLRLGRSSKVASELEEAQFKNKLTAARESIVKNVAKRREELTYLYEQWSQIYEQVNDITASLNEEKEFDRFLVKLSNRLDAVVSAGNKLKTFRQHIVKIASALPNIRNGNGFWAVVPRALRALPYRMWKRYVLAEMRREVTMQKTINVMIDRYNRYSAALYEHRFVKQKRATDDLNSRLEKLQALCQQDNPFFTLTPESFKNVRTRRGIVSLGGEISDGLARVRKTIQELDKWKADVESAQNYALRNLVLENVNVVGATCISSSNKPFFSELPYDVVILDEAGQIQIHNCLVPMTRASKIIMLGDHKQLPPMADPAQVKLLKDNGQDTWLYRNSLFEKLYEGFPREHTTMLDTQFRIPSGVADFLSHEFYKGNYLTHPNKASERFTLDFLCDAPLVLIDTSDSDERLHSVQRNGNKEAVWNTYESRIATALYRKIQHSPYKEWETKILAGLNRQVTEMREMATGAKRGVVSTVDSFQGQECDVVIYSFTRSADVTDDGVLSVGFLGDLRRLNVAMSRAKKVLVIIGDFSYLDACGEVLNRSTDKNKKFAAFIHDLKATANEETNGLPTARILRSKDVLQQVEVVDV